MKNSVTNWPDKYKPEQSSVYSYNELEISADVEVVWDWLICATLWPNWYVNSKNVVIENSLELKLGTIFRWTTFGIRVCTKVVEFEPMKYLAWSGARFGSSGYHSWTLKPISGKCLVITEETQQGLIPSIFRIFLRKGLHHYHQLWLEGLAKMASTGLPPKS